MSSENGNWCLIESDPAVFTELLSEFGVKGLECEEVYDIQDSHNISDAFGLIFLFDFNKQSESEGKLVADERSEGIFFAKQTINNACATQALINILLNLKRDQVDVGSTLRDFGDFVQDFDSNMKGVSLSNSDQIRSVHNSFSGCQGFDLDDHMPRKKEATYHFISFVPVNSGVYELDGLKPAPIFHGTVAKGANWIDTVRTIIASRMVKHMDGNFNLLAIVPKRLDVFQSRLLKAQSSEDPQPDIIKELESRIRIEKEKAISYKNENIRRRHNYMPLIVELLKVMGENGVLKDHMKNAQTMARDRHRQVAAAVEKQ